MSESTAQPIIVIKKKGGHGGHHGGAWKVAYADFVTAMMSLFIVLWLMNSTPQVKKAIAGYFNDPRGVSHQMGTDLLGDGPTLVVDQKSVEQLKEQIKKAIIKQKELDKLKDQIELKMTNEGLRIELIEGKNGTFFESGSPKPSESGEKLLALLAQQLGPLPNKLLIEGHTDAKPIGGNNGYSNWELSTDRANEARKLLQQNGVGATQVSQVRGYADQSLRVANDPLDPSNRRISLIVQFVEAPPGTKGPQTLDAPENSKGAKNGEGKAPEGKTEKPGEAAKPSAGVPATPAPIGPASAPAPVPAKPADVAPASGKINLPPVPGGKPGEKLDDKLNQLRQIKKTDPGHGK